MEPNTNEESKGEFVTRFLFESTKLRAQRLRLSIGMLIVNACALIVLLCWNDEKLLYWTIMALWLVMFIHRGSVSKTLKKLVEDFENQFGKEY